MKNNTEKTCELIVRILENSKFPMTITEISKKLKISRPTVSKYLLLLESKERVKMRRIGVAKAYFLNKKR